MVTEFDKVPKHIAIIMDGNGRWAKKRFMPRVAGHRKGVQAIKKVTMRANELGIQLVTLYAFSTENWGRPQDEVSFLMKLPKDFFGDFLPQLLKENIRVEVMGDVEKLPIETYQILNEAIQATKECTGMVLNFAINYGSRQEITGAIQQIVEDIQAGKLESSAIDDNLVNTYLMTKRYGSLSDPDLIIRTSGEQRLSNFLLWQAAYSEFYFTPTLWPDFDGKALDEAIQDYNTRQRRFGKVEETPSS